MNTSQLLSQSVEGKPLFPQPILELDGYPHDKDCATCDRAESTTIKEIDDPHEEEGDRIMTTTQVQNPESVVSDPDTSPTQSAPDSQHTVASYTDVLQEVRQRYRREFSDMSPEWLLAVQTVALEELAEITDDQLESGLALEELSLGDLSRVAEENYRRNYNFQCRLAFALQGWFETLEARGATLAHKGKHPFKNAKDFVSRLLGIDKTEVDRRWRIAGANSSKPRASKMRAPKIEQAMAEGRIDPSSADFSIDRLRSIRAAAKRTGATDEQADQLVATKEGEFLAKALNASPDEVRKFADRVKRSTNRKFIKPSTRLTPKQRKYEEGLRFISPLGDNHVRLDWVLTNWQYRNVLERLRQHVNNLRTEASKLYEDNPAQTTTHQQGQSTRLTPADEEYDLPLLLDDRTPAQRWSHFLLDILETGIVLNSTTSGQLQEHLLENTVDAPEDIAASGAVIPGLGKLLNVAPQVSVGLQYSDLAGQYLDFGSEDPNVQSEIAALISGRKPFPELYDYESMDLDWATLRQISCDASILPIVLNSRGEPLDVGRAQRGFPLSIRRAVILRDGGCAYPGCNIPHMYSEVHHIQHWQDNGVTSLENAVMLCRFHHMTVHRADVLIRLDEYRFPEFLMNSGTQEARWVRNLMHRG